MAGRSHSKTTGDDDETRQWEARNGRSAVVKSTGGKQDAWMHAPIGRMKTPFSLNLELKIRQCARPDLPQLEWFGLYTEHRQLIEDAFRRQQAGEVMMLVADLDGFPVGQAWLDLTAREADSVGVIWAVRVFPVLRNHGIGTHLMIAAEQLLTERGFRWVELTVDQQEPRPRRLYERLGYRSAGSTEGLLSYTTPEEKSVAQNLQLWILRKPLRPGATDREVSQTSRE